MSIIYNLSIVKSAIINLMNQKGFVPILIVIILAAALLGGYLLYQKQTPVKSEPPGLTVTPDNKSSTFKDEAKIIENLSLTFSSKNIPGFKIKIDKIVGGYATGVGGVPPQGVAWIAMKKDGAWIKIWDGVNDISCSTVNQYNIPKEIYKDCSTNY